MACKRTATLACFVASLLIVADAAARPLNVVNFGGANRTAQITAWIQPFSQQSRTPVNSVEYTGDMASIVKMVHDHEVTWDVVELESADLAPACDSGLLEHIDSRELANSSRLLPNAVHECGVGAFVWSTVLAFDGNRLKGGPRNWADFWDTARFPGKRGLRKGPRYNLELALMADGVPREDVYEVLATEQGVTRALRKLEELKPIIVWWSAGAEPPALLNSGRVAMTTAFNGRVAAANRDPASNLEIVWSGALYEMDYWVIVKGSPQRDQALRFINFVTSESAQLDFSREIPYGPTNFDAILRQERLSKAAVGDANRALIDLSMMTSDLPSAPVNMRHALAFSPNFWASHGASIEKRFKEMFP